MARVVGRRTQVLHAACADVELDGTTAGELLTAHGYEYLAGCGWREARTWIEQSPLFRTRSAATRS